MPRYILAFPGLALALACVPLARAKTWPRLATFGLAAIVLLLGLKYAAPGLAGDGPPLGAYVDMDEGARLRAVGADGSPARYYDALAWLPPGATTGFDASLELPYLAWPSDLATRAIRLPDDLTEDEAARFAKEHDVSLLVVDKDSAFARAAARSGSGFGEAFQCRIKPPPTCMVAAAGGRPIPSCVGFLRH
jgi:hypothetical protein